MRIWIAALPFVNRSWRKFNVKNSLFQAVLFTAISWFLSVLDRSDTRGRIHRRNWDKSLKRFPPCYSQSPLLIDFTPPPPPPDKSGWKLACNVNIVQVYGNSSLRTLKIMPRNLNEIVRSWIWLLFNKTNAHPSTKYWISKYRDRGNSHENKLKFC